MAKEEFLNAALKTMKEEYGSINQFMIKGLNISMQQKEDLNKKYWSRQWKRRRGQLLCLGIP